MWINGDAGSWLVFLPLITNALLTIGVVVLAVFLIKKWIRREVARAIDQKLDSEKKG